MKKNMTLKCWYNFYFKNKNFALCVFSVNSAWSGKGTRAYIKFRVDRETKKRRGNRENNKIRSVH